MIVSISSPPKKMMSMVISGYDVQFLKSGKYQGNLPCLQVLK